jgi:hypothetical protein
MLHPVQVTVASWAERDDVVAELSVGDEDVGHLSVDPASGKTLLALYPSPSGADWQFELDDFEAALR